MKDIVKKPVTGRRARVPVVMQMEALECGAACLTMIMAYYDKWVALEQVRSDCGVSRDGSNAKNILMAARAYGLDARGYKYEPEALAKEGKFPCIIHWNFNHFVVLCGFSGKYAYINDPARGSVKVSMEEFDKSFTGICLMFEPTENFEKTGRRKSTLEFARERLKGAGPAIVFVVTATVLAYVFEAVNPAFYRFFMDHLLTGDNRGALMPFIGLLSFFVFIQIITSAITDIYSLKIDGKMGVLGNSTYVWKVLRLPMEFFGQRLSGDILQRKSSNANIANNLVQTLTPIVINVFMMFFYLVIMIRYSPLLTLVGIANIMINAVFARIISKKRVNLTRLSMRDRGKLAATTMSGVMMIETIKSSGAELGFFKKWAGLQAAVNKEDIEYSHLNLWFGSIPELLSTLSNYLVLAMGIALVIRGDFTLGKATGFQMYLGLFIAPAMSIITAGQSIQETRTQMERIEDVMKYPVDSVFERREETTEEEYAKLKGDVELKNVTFGYSKLSEPVIKDLSINIKRGSKIAIVGASGCGKSTISKLVTGLYKPWSGEILFDGKRIDEINRNVFTGSVAVVDQDITLFEDTIDQNIKLWDSSIEDFEVILAARDARIHDEIMERPEGYKAHVEEGGKNLSGGQKQRIEIARVLSQDPSIIILDEATSALDSQTEAEVVNAISQRGITCIVIAHRLSTIRDCDEIIVLDKGEISERGTHDELFATEGLYRELVINE
ncbi:MAG: NHLP family bacteriocin export ABC transporter peptidase/permease/ATPase subunit [Butyrivibrio sp.]|nr:NHLP family bacteriocin export ABC transporter peptidase/permease/ATPase subunit [Butyrivibrio sp.]